MSIYSLPINRNLPVVKCTFQHYLVQSITFIASDVFLDKLHYDEPAIGF
jgi:hypothetical protein